MIYRWIFPRTIKWYSNIRETGSVLKYVLFFLIDHLKRTLHRRLSAEKKTRLFQNKIIPFSVWFRSNNIRYENKSKRNFWEHRLSFFFFWTFIFYFATGIKTKKKMFGTSLRENNGYCFIFVARLFSSVYVFLPKQYFSRLEQQRAKTVRNPFGTFVCSRYPNEIFR